MIDSELTFKKLGLMGRFQIVSFLHVVHSRGFVTFLHVVHSRGFVSLSFVEISYIMNTHQELDEILEVSSTVYINKICIQLFLLCNHISCCVSICFRPHARGRTFKLETHKEILVKFEFENRMTFSLRR